MAKVLKEESPLDIGGRELAELRNRLDKAQHNRAKLKQELDTLWAERLAPSAASADGQKRSIDLKALISDEEEIIQALQLKIEERQQDIQTVTKEKARSDANAMVEVAMAEFEDLMAAFADPIAMAEDWLRQANEASHRYSSCNPGDVNRKLAPKIETVTLLLRSINNGRKL